MFILLAAALVAVRLFSSPAFVADPQPPVGQRATELADRIDPNTATQAQLAALPGLGPKRAADVVAGRAAGRYKTASDLQRISGIGEAIVAKLEPFLRFDTAP